MSKIRLLVADENLLFRTGVTVLLKRHPDVEVIGEATNGKDAVKQALKDKPDIVLVNISIPMTNGIGCIYRIRHKNKDIKVLLVSECEDVVRVLQGLKAGASGYINMNASASDLVSAIRTVHRGGYFLYPPLARKLVRGYFRLTINSISYDPYANLTDREREVLRMIAEGRQNTEIARRLGIAVKTASLHRNKVAKKLGGYQRSEPDNPVVDRYLVNRNG